MPNKRLKRWLPDAEQLLQKRSVRWFAPYLHDPRLWHFNRRSLTKAVYIGVMCAFFPLPGQMLLALLGALWRRANVPLSLALTWITNPLTTIPIFYAAYHTGARLLGKPLITLRLIAQVVTDVSLWLFADGAAPWLLYRHTFSLSAFVLGLLVLALLCGMGSGIAFALFWRYKTQKAWRRRQQTLRDRSNESSQH